MSILLLQCVQACYKTARVTEITYDQAAKILDYSPRHTRTLLRKHRDLCPMLKYGYKTIRFPLDGVLAVRMKISETLINRAVASGAGRRNGNGKGKR